MSQPEGTVWEHDHSFGQDQRRAGESKTLIVIVITSVMMVVEIAAGILFGSMALLADGLHMASHAAALTVSVFAYIYARRHAHDRRFSFGTGKVNALGGFTGAILLGVFALAMTWESVDRLIFPVEIAFGQAIFVAVLGLIVNGVSVFILEHDDHHSHGHGHDHDDGHHHDHDHGDHAHDSDEHHDHNLRAAYLHVLADALTSVLAIVALLAARYFGTVWMDPVMGLVGAVLVSRWSIGLLKTTGRVLLDQQASNVTCDRVRECLEQDGSCRVADLHIWTIGPGIQAAAISVITETPKPLADYRRSLELSVPAIVHSTIEVHQCQPRPADRSDGAATSKEKDAQ